MLNDLSGANVTTLGTGSGNSARVDSSTVSGCLFIDTEGEALVVYGDDNINDMLLRLINYTNLKAVDLANENKKLPKFYITLRRALTRFIKCYFSRKGYKEGRWGFIIAIMGCYNGIYSSKGAEGVGRATTSAVVSASIIILASNYFLTELLFKP